MLEVLPADAFVRKAMQLLMSIVGCDLYIHAYITLNGIKIHCTTGVGLYVHVCTCTTAQHGKNANITNNQQQIA